MVEWKISKQPVEYNIASDFMLSRVNSIINQQASELIWFLEHPPIFTAGTGAKEHELLYPQFPVYRTGRGGKFTYHGPGQLIIYLLLDLRKRNMKDVKQYVFNLEQVIINSLKDLGIPSARTDDKIGVWTYCDGSYKKIAALGIRIKKWVTYHGCALNINPDLSHYAGIIPCGIENQGVTSLFELQYRVARDEVINFLQKHIEHMFISSK